MTGGDRHTDRHDTVTVRAYDRTAAQYASRDHYPMEPETTRFAGLVLQGG